MPQRRSAIKELRKNRKNRLHNLDIKTALRKTLKSFISSVEKADKNEAGSQIKTVYKKLDKAAKRNIIHKNTASRRKARFGRMLQNMEQK